jgi:prephenate dehydrogenase
MRYESRIGIIGLGQIGCSLGLALKKTDLCDSIIGYDASPSHALQAAIMGGVDGVVEHVEEIVRASDVLFVCSPLHTMEPLFALIGEHAAEGTLVSDVGSVKAPLLALAAKLMPQCHFIPGHPIAGTEKSGPTQGNPELFRNQKIFFTPSNMEASLPSLAALQRLWTGVGAKVELLEAGVHDQLYGMTSHLAQLLMYAVAAQIAAPPARTGKASFYQFMRIAGSDAVMWADIFHANRHHLLEALMGFIRALDTLTEKAKEGFSLEAHLAPLTTWRKGARRMLHPEKWELGLANEAPPVAADVLPLVVGFAYVAAMLEAEKNLDTSLAAFLGAGFYGVSLPAVCAPEVAALLLAQRGVPKICTEFRAQLMVFAEAIDGGDNTSLLALIHSSKAQHSLNMKALGVEV